MYDTYVCIGALILLTIRWDLLGQDRFINLTTFTSYKHTLHPLSSPAKFLVLVRRLKRTFRDWICGFGVWR